MTANQKRKTHKVANKRDKRERGHEEAALDDALKNTFPASDPVSIVQPAPPAGRPREHQDLKMDAFRFGKATV
jgi:hypothetical protein